MKELDGKSGLTSNAALIAFYILTFVATTFFATLIPLILILIAEGHAQREQAPLVKSHTKWLSRTILFGWLWGIILIVILSVSIISVSVDLSDAANMSDADIVGYLLNWSLLVPTLCLILLTFWQYYRIIRGLIMCVSGRAPKANMV